MKKKKFNIFGNGFTHKTGGNKGYSAHGKVSKHIDWVQDGTGEANFYFNSNIRNAFTDKTELPKYAWVFEARTFSWMNPVYSDIETNLQKYLDTFECIFTHDPDLLKLDSKFKYAIGGFWIKDAKVYDKSKMISMISSNKSMCDGHIKRLEWVEMLRDQVDLYGRGFNPIQSKEEGLCDYMFSVVIENSEVPGFFTEKILDCFASGTIPIYLGAPNIGEYFNQDGIIFLSEEFDISEDIYFGKMEAILDNLERCKKYEISEDYVWENYLKYTFEKSNT
jgi:hypothetical protein